MPQEDEFSFLRVDPESNQVVGPTMMNASRYLAQLARASAMKVFDDPNMCFLLERRVGSFSLDELQMENAL